MKKLILIILLFSFTGCTKNTQVHPGSIDKTDSVMYDSLTVAQSTIDTLKKSQLTQNQKDFLNTRIIPYYNIARKAWLDYRNLKSSLDYNSKLAALNQAINDLTSSITLLRGVH